MAGKTSKKATKVVRKPTPRRVAKKGATRSSTAMPATPRKRSPRPSPSGAAPPVLLSGGNPQIAKGYGDAPVQAYLAALPGWKRDVGQRLDALVVRLVPGVQKAVKWNTPLYGMPGQGWFLGVHAFTKYLKVTFFRGASLRPVPPGESKSQDTRYFHIRQDEPFDEAQLAAWVKQASQLPGEDL